MPRFLGCSQEGEFEGEEGLTENNTSLKMRDPVVPELGYGNLVDSTPRQPNETLILNKQKPWGQSKGQHWGVGILHLKVLGAYGAA